MDARAAERRYAPGGSPRALEGLPIAAKEALALAGRLVTGGLRRALAEPTPAPQSAWALQRALDAGGIVHARTTTSELCCMPASHAVRWGLTRNPWDPGASAGGSSGGSAAALAAGTSTLAIGSDVGGSIRAPACLCGVVGYKPPHGLIPVEPPEGRDRWMHLGPMARTVADVALLRNALAGPHLREHAPRRAPEPLELPIEGPSGLRVGCCARPGDLPVDARVAENALASADALRGLGVQVRELELAWRLEEVKRAMWGRGDMSRARSALALERSEPGALSPYTVLCMERSIAMSEEVPHHERARLERRIDGVLAHALRDLDAVIIPTMGAVRLDAGEDYVDRPLIVDGRALDHFCDAALTPMLNISSRCPVLAIPSGFADGLPTGVQVIARPYDERTAFRVAAGIERARPWPTLEGRPAAASGTA